MTHFGESLTTEQLIELRDRTLARAQAVVDMGEEESKRTPEGKHSAPLEGGFVNVVFAQLAQRELDRRAQILMDFTAQQMEREQGA